ncbi:exopolysaccharide biosynthesis protein [Devosia rhizoryzae]|uniref:Exopolysaccharide biosynthesis protein n=1 Tax=Devosia rhizoryzae TaxID=2774137 RepID=A0ABX7CFI0_9HYPH|nr:exopolysaccharide biosynthesis protein [Devosia rhizoryzae]QQR40661.1 exopolysaccharide biosynthesis protein [Devosia rhizoryzae]
MADASETNEVGGPVRLFQDEPAERLSGILTAIAADRQRDRISIGYLLQALEHRAVGALMFIFAIPNAIPVPPGVSAVLGAPLIFLSFQMMLGQRPWLPKIITNRSLSRGEFEKVVSLTAPWLARAERLMRPRFTLLARPPMEYVVGAICLLLSIILFLPIPLGNMLPAFTICVLAMGVLERDGFWVTIGIVCSIVAVLIVWGVVLALLWSALFVISNVFGLTLPF